jgi:phosphoenolpyruvate-protein kinase (PTS system EI component)
MRLSIYTTRSRNLPEMPLSICGELAGRPGQVERILQCGIETMSVAPPMIPEIKQSIRECR